MGKSIISMAISNSFLFVYQRVVVDAKHAQGWKNVRHRCQHWSRQRHIRQIHQLNQDDLWGQ